MMDIQRKCFEEKMCHKLVGDFNAMNNRYNELTDQLMWEAWQAAKAQANKQFENFIDQAIEDSACADERRSLQRLLDEFLEQADDN